MPPLMHRKAAGVTRYDIIEDSLVRVAEICGDPRDRVYGRLFDRNPEFEMMFIMDSDGGVRGSMLQQAIECLLDFAGPRVTSPSILASERERHFGYGVPEDHFERFLEALRDTVREVIGESWTPVLEEAWASLLEDMAAYTRPATKHVAAGAA